MNDGRESSAGWLLALIGEHRATIREALDDEQHTLLLARLGALAEVAPDDDRAVRRALQGVRLALLPLPLDHPVRVALDSVRLVAASPGPVTVAAAQELMASLSSPPPQAAAPDQLLLAQALSAEEARARCGDTAPPPELIRLPDPQGDDRYPEFQFTAGGGTPYEVVLEVNRLLLADVDPWGAASWWLSGNTWLGGTPVSLLGRLPDQQLLGAATALVEGD
ncbi:hypothetical protein [Streptomyces fulvoviolaceus]|uniref:hypothetical protein n=1 Tax=Streptomyces fulvoviolaceus TaxID=285535 RepID=UPI0004C5F2E1|nr:hypothetical protein [Streptomyces fulvoviolaceus]MCT9075989.1 hypothetical protein [Streptomyces fulvoviolaceus]